MCGPILWSIKRTQKWVCRPSILVHEIDSKLGPPIRHKSQPKTKSAFAHFAFCGSVGQGNRSRALPEHVRFLSRQIFRQCFVAWLGGWFAAVQPVFTAAFAAHFQGHFADPFWDLRHLRGPFFGPFCGPIFGTWFWVP